MAGAPVRGLPLAGAPFSAAWRLRAAPAFARRSCPFGDPRVFRAGEQMGFQRGLGRSLGNGRSSCVRRLCFICGNCLT